MIERRNDFEASAILPPETVIYQLDTGWDRGHVAFREGEIVEKETSPCFRKVAHQGEDAVRRLARAHGWFLKESKE